MLNGIKKILFGGSSDASKSVAKSRLHFVLVQDRTGLTNDEMSEFRSEMVKVIERYFMIDKDAFDIKYQRDNETTTLLINSPIIVRRSEPSSNKRASVISKTADAVGADDKMPQASNAV